MGHVQKKLYSTAAKLAISPSSLSQFPPREFEKNSGVAAPAPSFDADVWASLQPPAKSALFAFSHRIGLGNVLTSDKTIQQACVHPSFLTFHQKYYPNEPLPRSNAQLAAIGNSLMGLFASEYLHASYPHLPLRVLKAAVSAHVGPMTCASVAQEMGATPLLRWHRQVCLLPYLIALLMNCLTARNITKTSPPAHRRVILYPPCHNRPNISRTFPPCRTQIRAFLLPQQRGRYTQYDQVY